MPTDKPKIIIVIESELLERIDDYRYASRIPNRSDAIRRLLDEALKKYEKPPQKPRKPPKN